LGIEPFQPFCPVFELLFFHNPRNYVVYDAKVILFAKNCKRKEKKARPALRPSVLTHNISMIEDKAFSVISVISV
jgi:hypothetical protein